MSSSVLNFSTPISKWLKDNNKNHCFQSENDHVYVKSKFQNHGMSNNGGMPNYGGYNSPYINQTYSSTFIGGSP